MRNPVAADADFNAAGASSVDLVTELERLAALHATGALSDPEFHAAKARLLGETAHNAVEAGVDLSPRLPTAAAAELPVISQEPRDLPAASLPAVHRPLRGRFQSLRDWYRARTRAGQWFLGGLSATLLGFFTAVIHPVFAAIYFAGLVGAFCSGLVWLVSRTSPRWKLVLLGFVGLVVGIPVGFGAVFFVMSGSHAHGEMAGVAAIGGGLFAGAPIGGILGCAGGVWWGRRLARRSQQSADEPHFSNFGGVSQR